MNNSDLLIQAEQAFTAKKFDQGLAFLRKYNFQTNTHDASNWHRQAVLEEQIGDFSSAGEAHYKCIEIAPNNALGYLYAGFWLQQQEQANAAASLYSLAEDLDPSILLLWQNPDVSEPTRLRSKNANKLLANLLSEQHRLTCSELKHSERIKNAIWVKTHDQAVSFEIEDFSPELFFIPDLATKPIYSDQDFSWAKTLHTRHTEIKDELTHAMLQQHAKDNLRPYLGSNFSKHLSLNQLANSTDWMAIDLFNNGQLNSEVSALFPATLDALESIPTYNLEESPFEVFFSFLRPNQSIPAHFGQSNHALTVHLPLDIPTDCYLQVASQKHNWREDQLLIFDDSFFHSAHNNSDQTRVVLIFSIWHPDLTEIEKKAIKHSFQTRQKWVSQRQTQLQKLRLT